MITHSYQVQGLLVCNFRWAFELIAVAAGAMGDLPIAAQSILMTVDSVFALIPFG
jgi:MATE family multidrug resistance protein